MSTRLTRRGGRSSRCGRRLSFRWQPGHLRTANLGRCQGIETKIKQWGGIMQTIAMFLKENQTFVLQRIIEELTKRGEWGTYGLFAEIGASSGFSSSYVGRLLTGKQRLTEAFVTKIAEYLEISVMAITEMELITSNKSQEIILGKTPEWLVELLTELVAEKGQSAVARESGLTLLSIQRYLKGIGEPRLSSIQRLADYTGRTFIIEIKPSGQQD